MSLVQASPWKVTFAIPWSVCRKGARLGVRSRTGWKVAVNGKKYSRKEKGKGTRESQEAANWSGFQWSARSWQTCFCRRMSECGTQNRGNSRGYGFISGQEADLELEGALRHQEGYSSAHSRTLPVRIIHHRCMPDQFWKVSSSRCPRTFPDLAEFHPLH